MTVLSVLYDIIIAPIEYLIEMIFCFIYSEFPKFGTIGAIMGISLVVNFLALPLYLKADELQLAERRQQERMQERIKKIKKAFHGDEQFMMLTEYYKRNDYHPLYALRSSLSILIEIPFFIAAYHFLSNCVLLEGSEWIFADLSQPDQLLGGINILPVIMTAVNFISTAVYTKGAPFREKAQAYLLAVVFLVILYQSPSGLVFYWILNNLFSLLKNMAMKLKRPVYALYAAVGALFAALCIYFGIHPEELNPTRTKFLYAATVLWIAFPICRLAFNKIVKRMKPRRIETSEKNEKSIKAESREKEEKKKSAELMLLSCIALWIMGGALLPSSVIATSPTEFSFLGSIDSPLTYVFMNLTFYFGLFVFWPLCIYKMFQKKVKKILPALFFIMTVCAVFNIYLFKSQFGNITTAFEPEDAWQFLSSSNSYALWALISAVPVVIICYLAFRYRKQNILCMLLLILVISEGIICGKNMITMKKEYDTYAARLEHWQTDDTEEELQTEFSLSKTGRNVLVLFCDRAASAYFPYVLEQFPELKEAYEGFTYYPNCISFSTFTLTGAPAMMGGYEYTPLSMNQREETLVNLHNESIMTLPVWFDRIGYDVKVADPPYANYSWDGDYSPFEQYEDIEVCSLADNYMDRYVQEHREEYTDVDYGRISIKNCRLYAILQMLYPPLRNLLIGDGRYYSTDNSTYYQQESFLKQYAYMTYLPQITDAENDEDTYTFMTLELTHEYQMLLAPDYRSGLPTKEHPYAGIGSYPEDASIVDPEKNQQSYHVNASSLLLLAKYFEALKEMGVYDNTRIIIVSDHGSKIPTAPFWEFNDPLTPSTFHPLLLVKDFYSSGEVRTDMTMRTNADVPYLATEGLGALQVNPFTGNPFTRAEEYSYFDVFGGEIDQRFLDKELYEFDFDAHYTVRDNIFDETNWTDEGKP